MAIAAVAWAPDGSLAVSGDEAGELTLWQEGKAVATAQVPESGWILYILNCVLNGTSVA